MKYLISAREEKYSLLIKSNNDLIEYLIKNKYLIDNKYNDIFNNVNNNIKNIQELKIKLINVKNNNLKDIIIILNDYIYLKNFTREDYNHIGFIKDLSNFISDRKLKEKNILNIELYKNLIEYYYINDLDHLLKNNNHCKIQYIRDIIYSINFSTKVLEKEGDFSPILDILYKHKKHFNNILNSYDKKLISNYIEDIKNKKFYTKNDNITNNRMFIFYNNYFKKI
jgi:hypothetical protein